MKRMVMGVAVAVALVAGLAVGDPSARASGGQGFEYKFVVASSSKTGWFVTVDDSRDLTEKGQKTGEPMVEFINGLGAKGWDLVGYQTTLAATGGGWDAPKYAQRFVFKRAR